MPSGAKCNSYLYFTFRGEEFDTKSITAELKIQPTSVKIKQDPVPKSTSWDFRISVGEEIDLETPQERLIEKFEPKANAINSLKAKYQLETVLQFVIEIDVNPQASTPYFGLNKRALNFLNQTATEVDYDLYKADPAGIITAE